MDTVAERGEARGRSEDHEPLRQVGQDLPLYRVLVTALAGRLHPSATPIAWQRGAEERRAGRSLERGRKRKYHWWAWDRARKLGWEGPQGHIRWGAGA